MAELRITITVNGTKRELDVQPDETLVQVLRERLGLTGTKTGCRQGECGACTINVNGKAILSCLMLAVQADGKEVLTVEGLRDGARLHPLQESFIEHGAAQCGFCTCGMLMSAVSLLEMNPHPGREEIAEYMSGNLCRCGCYEEIIEAILALNGNEDQEHKP